MTGGISVHVLRDPEAISDFSKSFLMDKEDVVYIYNRILFNHKKEWSHAICSNMDGPGDYHTK